jgi:hypothetical protein
MENGELYFARGRFCALHFSVTFPKLFASRIPPSLRGRIPKQSGRRREQDNRLHMDCFASLATDTVVGEKLRLNTAAERPRSEIGFYGNARLRMAALSLNACPQVIYAGRRFRVCAAAAPACPAPAFCGTPQRASAVPRRGLLRYPAEVLLRHPAEGFCGTPQRYFCATPQRASAVPRRGLLRYPAEDFCGMRRQNQTDLHGFILHAV